MSPALKLIEQFEQARAQASPEVESEDFNNTLLTASDRGHQGFEMRKPDRDFFALAANKSDTLCQMLKCAIEALEWYVAGSESSKYVQMGLHFKAKHSLTAINALAKEALK